MPQSLEDLLLDKRKKPQVPGAAPPAPRATGIAPAPAATPAVQAQPQSRMADLLLGGTAAVAAKAKTGVPAKVQPGAAAEPEDEGDPYEGLASKVSRIGTQSLLKTITGKGLAERFDTGLHDRIVRGLQQVLPSNKQGEYVAQLAGHLARMGPELPDALLSPLGLGLAAAHVFPATFPFAVVADFLLAGNQALRTIPSVIEAAKDPDPAKVADAFKDALYAMTMVKGTGKLALQAGLRRAALPVRPIESQGLITRLMQAPDLESQIHELEVIRDSPKNTLGRWQDKLYSNALTRSMAAIFDVPRLPVREASSWMVNKRGGQIAAGLLSLHKFLHEFRDAVPPEWRDIEKFGFMMEGSLTPEQAGMPEKYRPWLLAAKNIQYELDNQMLRAYGPDLALRDTETYLMHKWAFDNPAEMLHRNREAVSRRLLKDPQLQERKIETYKEGMYPDPESGLQPLTPAYRDVSDIIQKRHELSVITMANREMLNTMTDTGMLMTEQKAAKQNLAGFYEPVSAKMLERAVYGGKSKSGETILKPKPVWVHPEIRQAVEAVFGDSWPLYEEGTGKRTAFGWMELIRSFGKQMNVSSSFFHEHNIAAQLVGQAFGSARFGMLGRVAKGVVTGPFIFNPSWWQGIASGATKVAQERGGAWKALTKIPGVKVYAPPQLTEANFPAAREWTTAGGVPYSEEAHTKVTNTLRNFVLQNPVLNRTAGGAVRFLGDLNYIHDTALWRYYLPGAWHWSAETIFMREMKAKLRTTPEEVFSLRHEIAMHNNKSFGTENLESMLLSPKARQLTNIVIFAPNWTFSNFRVIANGFQSHTGARLARRGVGGTALAWFVGSNLVNYAMTSWVYTGQDGPMPDKDGVRRGHFMWDNGGVPIQLGGKYIPDVTDGIGHIEAGWNDNGTIRRWDFGTALMEPLKLAFSPWQFWASKMGQLPKKAVEVLFGDEPGTGFKVIDPNLSASEQAVQRTKVLSELFTPYAAQDVLNRAWYHIMPEAFPRQGASQATAPYLSIPAPIGLKSSQAISVTRAVKAYAQAKAEHRDDVAAAVLQEAARNGYPPRQILRTYRDQQNRRRRAMAGPKVLYDERGNQIEPEEPPEIRP